MGEVKTNQCDLCGATGIVFRRLVALCEACWVLWFDDKVSIPVEEGYEAEEKRQKKRRGMRK